MDQTNEQRFFKETFESPFPGVDFLVPAVLVMGDT